MAFENIVIYKGSDYHSAFPHIIRLQSGELVTRCRAHPEETVKDWHERNISGEKFTEIAEKENKSKNTISGAVSRYRTKIRFYEETN